jgi:hypothetical protein
LSRTTSTGRPRQSSTSSTKTAAGGSGKSRRSTSAGTPTGTTSPGRISSHRNWLAIARKLAGRYRRKNVSRRLGPLVFARITHLVHRLLQSRRLMLFLSWPGPRGVVPRAGRKIAAPPATTRLPGATTLRRRVNRGTGTAARASKASPSRRAADAPQSRWKESIGTVAALRAWKVDRSVAWLRAPSDPSLPAPRTVAAEATRFGGRTRQRRSRSEERRTGVTTTVIERATSFPSHPEKGAMTREGSALLAPGSIPGVWEATSPQMIDVSRLTEEVLTQIDRRVVARRERFGRI